MSRKTEKKQAVARNEMTKARWTWHEIKRNKAAYLMVAPFMIIFMCFTILPVVLSAVLSLTNFNLLQIPDFVGADNYIRLFLDDDIFIIACQNTLIFAAIVGPVSYLMSFLVAWFINELPPKIRAVVTLIFYAPSISGNAYLIWKTLFSSDRYGWANAILLEMDVIDTEIAFFEDADYVMPLCIIVALWTSLGTSFLAFIAGLQGIDKAQFEAGAVDGVRNRWQELYYITLPNMKDQLMFGAIMAITGSFGFGAVVDALCGFPSVDYAAHTIVHHLNDYGGSRFETGYASAIAVILFIVMVGANSIVKKVISKVGS